MTPNKNKILNELFFLRLMTAPLRTMPDFLIIGAQKSATTSLFQYLCQHPRVRTPFRKEIHFFDLRSERGLNWYRAHFPLKAAMAGGVTGEASTGYLFMEEAPARARLVLPGAKLIVILRDPVDRALSQYKHELRRGRMTMSFGQYVGRELDGGLPPGLTMMQRRKLMPVARGFYADQIRRWMAHYPRESFLFLKFETFAAEPQAGMNRVFDFLGLPHAAIDAEKAHKKSKRYDGDVAEAAERLRPVFASRNAELPALIGEEFVWP